MDIVQLIYRPHEPQGSCKDYEFSRGTMNGRWQQGLADARTTLAARPGWRRSREDVGVRVFDVMHDILIGKQEATPQNEPPMETPPPQALPKERKIA